VARLRVEVVLPLGGGVTDGLLNEHVGPLATAGATLQARVTAPLKLFCEVAVMVADAEAPECPEVGVSAPFVIVKFAPVPDDEYLTTKASPLRCEAVCAAATVGKSVELVLPVT
jgi:hypothetical protein